MAKTQKVNVISQTIILEINAFGIPTKHINLFTSLEPIPVDITISILVKKIISWLCSRTSYLRTHNNHQLLANHHVIKKSLGIDTNDNNNHHFAPNRHHAYSQPTNYERKSRSSFVYRKNSTTLALSPHSYHTTHEHHSSQLCHTYILYEYTN